MTIYTGKVRKSPNINPCLLSSVRLPLLVKKKRCDDTAILKHPPGIKDNHESKKQRRKKTQSCTHYTFALLDVMSKFIYKTSAAAAANRTPALATTWAAAPENSAGVDEVELGTMGMPVVAEGTTVVELYMEEPEGMA